MTVEVQRRKLRPFFHAYRCPWEYFSAYPVLMKSKAMSPPDSDARIHRAPGRFPLPLRRPSSR